MPRQSYDQLLNQNRELQRELGVLSTDPLWNITTYAALPFRLRREAESARYIVVMHIHNFVTAKPGAVRRSVNVRDASVLVRARWDNLHEVIFVLSTDPDPFCQKLAAVCRNEGLEITLSSVNYSGSITHDHDRAALALPVHVHTQGE